MKKVLLSIIIMSLMLMTFFQTVFSANAMSIHKEYKEIGRCSYKIYTNCTIQSEDDLGVSGTVFLFPGYFYSVWIYNTVSVKNAKGIILAGDNPLNGHLHINSDVYHDATYRVFGFTGWFCNTVDFNFLPLFDIDGVAKRVIVYY